MELKQKEKVNVLRARLNITQVELAKKAGISARSIHLFEKDVAYLRKAKYETLQKLASALESEVDDIFLG
ncbi:helix-turn-helix transcriptional regulator [Paenisporosarcina cavernae]|uniref:XRE family transcriptional regulator n=1 Tax=Paenisporosarcina cavernae TaxID=2320858 RepID=A0A385YS90_9BACL|nr:helix-turn-helix transcriptional regulator [Paenisporosarcina cavernae]AYC29675.1 XRE family transcriptional regulator [Paenisporosarcina cavernae]